MSEQMNDELIGIKQLASRLGVSERFVRRLVEERRIAFHKIGRYVRFLSLIHISEPTRPY